jgi:hypothetical protein
MNTIKKMGVVFSFLAVLLTAQTSFPQEDQMDGGLLTIAEKLYDTKEKFNDLRTDLIEKETVISKSDKDPVSIYPLLDSLKKIYNTCNYEYELLEIISRLKEEHKAVYYKLRKKRLTQSIDDIRTELALINMFYKDTQNNTIVDLINKAKKHIQSIIVLLEYGIEILQSENGSS